MSNNPTKDKALEFVKNRLQNYDQEIINLAYQAVMDMVDYQDKKVFDIIDNMFINDNSSVIIAYKGVPISVSNDIHNKIVNSLKYKLKLK